MTDHRPNLGSRREETAEDAESAEWRGGEEMRLNTKIAKVSKGDEAE